MMGKKYAESLHDAEAQMNGLSSFDHFCRFERDMLTALLLEQSYAAAEQHGDEVDRDFVNQAECDELPGNVRARY